MDYASNRQLPGFNLRLQIFLSRTNVHITIMCISFPLGTTVKVTVQNVYYCPTGPFLSAEFYMALYFTGDLKTKESLFYCLKKVDWCCVEKKEWKETTVLGQAPENHRY